MVGSSLTFVITTFFVFLALTLIWLAPIIPLVNVAYLVPRQRPPSLGYADSMLTSWMLAWSSHALRTNPLEFFNANIFYPLPLTFALSENLAASGLLITPVDVVWRNPVLDHNILLVASFVLLGTGTAALARELGAGFAGAWFAGVVVAFNPFRAETIDHVHALSTHWIPFGLWAIHRCLRRGRGAVAVAVTSALVALSSIYYAYFFFICTAVVISTHWALRCPAVHGGRWRTLAGMAAAAIITGAMLVPYGIARGIYALTWDPSLAWWFAARTVTYLDAIIEPLVFISRRYVAHEDTSVVIGTITFAFMLIGIAASAVTERRRIAAVYLLMGSALAFVSLGPTMQWRIALQPGPPGPWKYLAAFIPGFEALRVPARASAVAVQAVGVLVAFGADAVWRTARYPMQRIAVGLVLVMAGVLETWHSPFAVENLPWSKTGIPPVYDWLGRQPGAEAVLELPTGLPSTDARYMVMSARHWKPLVNGYSGFAPTTPFFRRFMSSFPNDPQIRLLHEIGVRWVVIHTPEMPWRDSGVCAVGWSGMATYITRPYRDDISCVFEIHAAPPPDSGPADRPVMLTDAIITTSDGASAAAATDGRVDSHYVQPVDRNREGWLQIDLPAPHPISRVVLDLGSHFGEYLRMWRIDVSHDGLTWTPVTIEPNAVPPLQAVRIDPSHLHTELRIKHPTFAKHVRVVRLRAEDANTFDVWPGWHLWGIHEMRLYETIT